VNLQRRLLQVFLLLLALSASVVANALPVVEYYNSALDAYFITGRANEQTLLDGSASFRRTGMSFQATEATVAGTALSRICRFYVSTSNPFSSSHFYGKEGSDCEGIRAQNVPGFSWEGYDFATVKPDANNLCPAANAPLFRGFRAGVNGKTSNHRYYPSLVLCEAGATEGYVCEGQTFCAGSGVSPPPTSGTAVRTYRGTFRGGQQAIEFSGSVTWSLVTNERGPAGELLYRVSAASAVVPSTFPACSAPGAVAIDLPTSALAVSEATTAGGSVRYGGLFRSIPVIITCAGNPPGQAPFGYLWFTCQTENNVVSTQISPSAVRLQGSCNANAGASFSWDFQAVD
jgi:hypothetical protein